MICTVFFLNENICVKMEIPSSRKSSRPRKPKTFFDDDSVKQSSLCLVCSVDVDTPPSGPSIQCHVCKRWVHYFCVPMSSEIHKKWEEEKGAWFLCRDCCFATESTYNFYTALQRYVHFNLNNFRVTHELNSMNYDYSISS